MLRQTLFDSIHQSLSFLRTDGVPDVSGLESDVITRRDIPYMERFFLLGDRISGSSVRYHHIVDSDEGDLHDHPWDFISIILSGSYVETTPTGEKEFGTGSVLVRPAEQLHRLTLVSDSVWTFVVLGPPRRRWGFQTSSGWVHWSDYQA